MAKFSIAQNPTFTADVEIPRVGGEPIKVKFTYRVLGRKELASIYDKWSDTAKSMMEMEDITLSQLADADIDAQVQQIKDIVVSWGFDDEYNDDSVYALCDTCVGAAQAIVEAYRVAYAESRSKN
jgi:hypothetical protein